MRMYGREGADWQGYRLLRHELQEWVPPGRRRVPMQRIQISVPGCKSHSFLSLSGQLEIHQICNFPPQVECQGAVFGAPHLAASCGVINTVGIRFPANLDG